MKPGGLQCMSTAAPPLQYGDGLRVFYGPYAQQGHGLGSFLGSLAKKAVPLLKEVGKRALKTGLHVAKNVLSGRNLQTSINSRAKQAAQQAGHDALGRLQSEFFGPSAPPLSNRKRKAPPRSRTTTSAPPASQQQQQQRRRRTGTRLARQQKIKRAPVARQRQKPIGQAEALDIFDL
jgi:hypothetical protein